MRIPRTLNKLLRRIVLKFKKEFSSRNILITMYVLLAITVFYHAYYAKRIIPGVKVGSVYVGGMGYDAAFEALRAGEEDKVLDLVFKYEDREFPITSEDIGFAYDWDSSVGRAFEVGRTGNIFVDTKDKAAGLFKTLYVGAFYDYEDEYLQTKFLVIRGELNESAESARLILEGGGLQIIPSSEGRRVDTDALYNITVESFDRMSFGSKKLIVEKVAPEVSEENILSVLSEVESLVAEGTVVSHEDEVWTLSPEQKLDLISFDRGGEEHEKLEDREKTKLALNEAKFGAFLEMLEQEVNELPRGQVTEAEDSRVADFEIIREGKEINVEQFKKDFNEALFRGALSMEIPIKTISGPDSEDRYGIFALLGEGSSKFAGSIPARIHNLTLAADRTNGVLVAPGSVYSLNKSIGDISGETGFDTAWIISGGRTVLGTGGGVCQVSTTVFRAVLNSGLPVVMRYPHDYRVHYYEEDGAVGFDAAIFQPSIDFRFKNDTAGYILVQSSWDLNEQSLTFKLYGTPDNREVEISEPVISGVTPPPAALYQDDPSLPKGVVKQIDWSAWGSNVYFTRTVTRDGKTLYEDTFSSIYRPWQAVFLVGTGI
jgi:vancomycin resistance protein YoaR